MTDNFGIFIWGTGLRARQLNEIYANELSEEKILGYIDNDKNKVGSKFFGYEVYSPSILDKYSKCYIYISVYKQEEIYTQICDEFNDKKSMILENEYFRKKKLITRYRDIEDEEIHEIVSYLNNNPLDVFNYEFTKKYNCKDMIIESENGLLYTIHNGKKMFFSKNYDNEEKVRAYYRSLLIEQDLKSPHRYLTDCFKVENESVVIDAGVAEGNFTLDIVDHIKRAYLFEPDKKWAEALHMTFSQYGDKVKIINKGVSDYCDIGTTTIDLEVDEECVDFIKMDIEGEEYYALNGAKNIINRSKEMKAVICTYHQEFAYDAINNRLKEYGFQTKHSDGYMWYVEHFNIMRPSVLRRGLIRAEKILNDAH